MLCIDFLRPAVGRWVLRRVGTCSRRTEFPTEQNGQKNRSERVVFVAINPPISRIYYLSYAAPCGACVNNIYYISMTIRRYSRWPPRCPMAATSVRFVCWRMRDEWPASERRRIVISSRCAWITSTVSWTSIRWCGRLWRRLPQKGMHWWFRVCGIHAEWEGMSWIQTVMWRDTCIQFDGEGMNGWTDIRVGSEWVWAAGHAHEYVVSILLVHLFGFSLRPFGLKWKKGES